MTGEFENRVGVVRRAKDADTFELTLKLAPRLSEDVTCRLLGFDCPESRRPASDFEIAKSHEALNFVLTWLDAPGDLWCRRELKTDSFGRELTTLWHQIDGIRTDLGEALFDAGLATRWPVRWRQVYDLRP